MAGGGKSRTCLTKALKYINEGSARIIIVRKDFPQLKISGGLIDESHQIYEPFGGDFNISSSIWKFKNGATIQFAPIPEKLSKWQGSQATHFLVDEAAEFTEKEILFLIGRIRSGRYKGHKSITLTCNPSRDSFLYEWVKYSLDEDGVPEAGTENITRWFINLGGKMLWANSIDELWETHGLKNGLVRDPKLGKINFFPKSFRFIPLTIYDNPVILKNDPDYLANLLAQPRVDQLRFLKGSWTARETGAGYFRREWVEVIDFPPSVVTSRVRSWDFAASKPSETHKDPDWTVGVKMSRDRFGIYYIEDVNRFRELTDKVLQEVIKTANHDGIQETQVTIPKDPGAGGKTATAFFLRTLAENSIFAKSVQISGHSGKIPRFLPFCTLAESGSVKMVRGDWNEAFLTELEFFNGSRNQKNDQVDATADAFNTISKQVLLPTFALPSMEMASPIPRM